MHFTLKPMDEIAAHAIVAWHYDGPYSFYDIEQDAEDLQEFLDQHNWEDSSYAVFDEQMELVGFFSFKQEGDSVEIGLALRPDLTGKGIGFEFMQAGLSFAKAKFVLNFFRLFVATFNQRAVRLYEKVGFKPVKTSIRHLNGADYEFLEMSREAKR